MVVLFRLLDISERVKTWVFLYLWCLLSLCSALSCPVGSVCDVLRGLVHCPHVLRSAVHPLLFRSSSQLAVSRGRSGVLFLPQSPCRYAWLGLGNVWVFYDTSVKLILLKWYRCLNSAWTDTKQRWMTLNSGFFIGNKIERMAAVCGRAGAVLLAINY